MAIFTGKLEFQESNKKKVLVIDDDPMVRRLLKRIAKTLDLIVIEAQDGRDAFDFLFEKTKLYGLPDLILVDVYMPHMDGISFCNKIKKELSFSLNRVIIISAISNKEEMDKIQKLETGGFIRKPFSIEDVRQLIKSLLEKIENLKSPYGETDFAVNHTLSQEVKGSTSLGKENTTSKTKNLQENLNQIIPFPINTLIVNSTKIVEDGNKTDSSSLQIIDKQSQSSLDKGQEPEIKTQNVDELEGFIEEIIDSFTFTPTNSVVSAHNTTNSFLETTNDQFQYLSTNHKQDNKLTPEDLDNLTKETMQFVEKLEQLNIKTSSNFTVNTNEDIKTAFFEHFYLGQSYFEMGVFDNAIEELEIAYNIIQDTNFYPCNFSCSILLAQCFINQKMFGNALDWLRTALYSIPYKEDALFLGLFYQLGKIYKKLGENKNTI